MEEGTPEERDKVSEQIKRLRVSDKSEHVNYIDNSLLSDYLINLGGLSNFMEYVRGLSPNGTLLDIGAGTTHAVSELEKSKMAGDLKFQATVLSRQKLIEKYLGYNRTRVTPVETLKSVEDESVTGIIANSSIAYSVSPRLAVLSINRVLIPGGVIKSSYSSRKRDPDANGEEHVRELSTDSSKFEEEFKKLGYDVATGSQYMSYPLLLAVKPGEGLKTSAQELLDLDNGVRDQLAYGPYR